MPTFTYKAVGPDGKTVEGTLTAENQQTVLRMLDEDSLFPVSVAEGGVAARGALGGGQKRVKLRQVIAFYSQMADLLRAGVPMLRSLDTLIKLTTNAVLIEVLKEVREDVAGGHTLAESMAKHPNVFTPLHASMIKAGESGGFLEDVLQRLAGFAEKQDELRSKLLGSMIYPFILVFVGGMIVSLLMVLVVPKFRDFLKEENFNALTHVVFSTSDFLMKYYLLVMVGCVAAVLGVWSVRRTEWGQMALARFQLKAPIFGEVFTMVSICRFCRILGTLLHNGVPILQSIKISKDSAGNAILSEVIERAGDNVKKGEALSKPLGDSGLFPLDIIAMMTVAEESNTLDKMLIEVADTNEARTARKIDLAVRLVEPILLICIAVLVLCIALALLLPILTMSSTGLGV
ncbi:MAG: type II secretion system F family protein [bacterium]|nr:type II secretion system F family protein [bacterium]